MVNNNMNVKEKTDELQQSFKQIRDELQQSNVNPDEIKQYEIDFAYIISEMSNSNQYTVDTFINEGSSLINELMTKFKR